MSPIPGIQPPSPLLAQYLALQDAIGLGAKVVRFSIGLEAVEDLIADCEQALAALG